MANQVRASGETNHVRHCSDSKEDEEWESNILPEMINAACCQKDFMTLLLDLVHTMWREWRVPRDWSDAILISISRREISAGVTTGVALLCWRW